MDGILTPLMTIRASEGWNGTKTSAPFSVTIDFLDKRCEKCVEVDEEDI